MLRKMIRGMARYGHENVEIDKATTTGDVPRSVQG